MPKRIIFVGLMLTFFIACTTVTIHKSPDGTVDATYTSTKDVEGFSVEITKTGNDEYTVDVKVAKADAARARDDATKILESAIELLK